METIVRVLLAIFFNNFHKSHVMSNGHIITFGIGVVGRVLISAIIHSPLPVKARLLL
jgi:hypothetical protein